jgi:sucrose-6-phosphate hydrolase SacC (GH32 family)
MYNWEKIGQVFDPTKSGVGDWMREYAQTPSTLIFSDFVRIYFCCRPLPVDGLYVSHLAYIDVRKNNLLDIIDISKRPIMNLGQTGTFDEFGIYPASVIRHENDIRVYYGGNTRCRSVPFNAAIGVGVSDDDGRTFKRLGPGPVLSYSYDEPFTLGSPKVRHFNGKWYLWYTAGKKWVEHHGAKVPVYRIRMAISDDGISWEKHGSDLLETILEANECQASADVTFDNGKYHMFFSYRYHTDFKEKGRGYRIGYAVSDDLVTWERKDDKAGIFPSKEGWDSESVSYAHVFKLDNKTYMLYQGNHMGKIGFGLAKLIGGLN